MSGFQVQRATSLELKLLLQGASSSVRLSLLGVYHVSTGKSYREVGALLLVKPHTVRSWVCRFEAQGLVGLVPCKGSCGRPSLLNSAQLEELRNLVLREKPCQQGYNTGTWTAPLLRDWIARQWGVFIKSNSTLYSYLEKLGISHQKSGIIYGNFDPESAGKMLNDLNDTYYKSLAECAQVVENQILESVSYAELGCEYPYQEAIEAGGVALLSLDEAHLSNTATPGYQWSEKGKQPTTQVQNSRPQERRTLFGAVQMGTGRVFTFSAEKGCAQSFLSFLQALLECYRKLGYAKIIVVLDNAKIHHAKLLETFLEQNKDKIELAFLPPYAPHLNPIERVWWLMRKKIYHNRYLKSIEQRLEAFNQLAQKWSEPNDEIKRLCAA